MDHSLDQLERLLDDEGHPPSDQVDDALRACLHWLNGLWEALGRSRFARSIKDENVDGDVGAETCAALVFARGEYVHARRDVGPESWGYAEGPMGEGPYGGGWMWPAWPRTGKYPVREAWYAARVARKSLLEPIREATTWLQHQRELHP